MDGEFALGKAVVGGVYLWPRPKVGRLPFSCGFGTPVILSIAQRGWKRGIAGAGRLDNMYGRRLNDLVVLIFDGQG